MEVQPNKKQQAFAKEFTELLNKYKASICLEDFGKGYVRDEKMVVDFDYDAENGGIINQIIIGSYVDGDSKLL